jgi:hypothetical protein
MSFSLSTTTPLRLTTSKTAAPVTAPAVVPAS